MAYLNIPHKNSAAYHSVMGCTTCEQLLNRTKYTVMAIEFHEMEGNTDQVLFFQDDLALIEKRLKLFAPKSQQPRLVRPSKQE